MPLSIWEDYVSVEKVTDRLTLTWKECDITITRLNKDCCKLEVTVKSDNLHFRLFQLFGDIKQEVITQLGHTAKWFLSYGKPYELHVYNQEQEKVLLNYYTMKEYICQISSSYTSTSTSLV